MPKKQIITKLKQQIIQIDTKKCEEICVMFIHNFLNKMFNLNPNQNHQI